MRRFRSRDFVRMLKRRVSQMRNWSTGRPEFVDGVVVARREDGTYDFKRDDWPGHLVVECQPASAVIPCPMRLRAFCESGNRHRLFVRWFARGIVPGFQAVGAVATSQWRYYCADLLRRNSWTEPTSLDLHTAAAGPGHAASPQMAFRVEVPETPGFGRWSHSNDVSIVSAWYPPFAGSLDVDELLAGADAEFDFPQFGSLARVNDWLYAEILSYKEDTETGDFLESLWVARFNAGRPVADVLELDWIAQIPMRNEYDEPGQHVPGADLAVLEIQVPGPEPLTELRAVSLWQDSSQIWIAHLNAETGGDLQQFAIGGRHDEGGGACVTFDQGRPRSWVFGDKMLIEASLSLHCVQITHDGGLLLWSSDDWDLPYQMLLCPLQIFPDGSLLAVYDGEEVVETVTDSLLTKLRFDFGNPYSEAREIGVGVRAGWITLDLFTGSVLGRTPFPDLVDGDFAEGARTETLWEGPTRSWEAPFKPTAFMDDRVTLYLWPEDYRETFWSALRVPRFYGWFWRRGLEYSTGDNPVLGAFSSWFPDGDPPGERGPLNLVTESREAWNAFLDAREVAHRSLVASDFNAGADSRPIKTGSQASQVIADCIEVTATAVAVTSDNVVVPIGNRKFTNVMGPEEVEFGNALKQHPLPWPSFEGLSGLPHEGDVPTDAGSYWDDYVTDPSEFAGLYSGGGITRAPNSGGTFTWKQRVIWRDSVQVQRQNTKPPLHRCGRSCLAGVLVVCGPEGGFVDGEWRALKWVAVNKSRVVVWSYAMPGSGGAVYSAAGTPVAVTDAAGRLVVLTCVTVGSVSRVVALLASNGERLDVDNDTVPAGMLETVFDGAHLVASTALARWGPAL